MLRQRPPEFQSPRKDEPCMKRSSDGIADESRTGRHHAEHAVRGGDFTGRERRGIERPGLQRPMSCAQQRADGAGNEAADGKHPVADAAGPGNIEVETGDVIRPNNTRTVPIAARSVPGSICSSRAATR